MKKVFYLLVVLMISQNVLAQNPFVTKWKTDNAGTSNSTSITIPTTGTGYLYDVDWNNDGTFEQIGLTGNVTHNYGTAGTYTVAIRGTFPRIFFNFGGDKSKILSIEKWGNIVWQSMARAFWGCNNLVLNATDVPNTAAVTDMSFMFYHAKVFNQNIGNFNIANAIEMTDIFRNSGISSTNYDAILIAWNSAGYTNKNLGNAAPLTYCAGQAARTNLTTVKGWTITGDMLSQAATATQDMTWNGSVNTDWRTPCNWSPRGIPTATNQVIIPATTNKPTISSGMAVAKSILIEGIGATLTVNSGATLTVSKMELTGGQIINNACGTIKVTGDYANNGTSITTNQGFILINGALANASGIFTNTGTLKYGSLTGTVTSNQNSSIRVNNSLPIFTYGGTFNGTINGIFRDSFATVSAGTFTAPNEFRPLQTLPTGSQTLYVKITPSGGACAYVVPFTYIYTPRVATQDVSNGTALHQNRPNPFSQQTTIAFDVMETNKAVLTVYDITGRQVFTSNKDVKMGYNEVILDKSILQNTGTYFYRLTTDKNMAVKRLQFVAE